MSGIERPKPVFVTEGKVLASKPARRSKHANVDVAFLAAQMKLKAIVKQRFDGDRDTAAFQGASLDVVLDVIVPALNAEGCSFRQPPRMMAYADRAISVVDTIITHVETGTVIKDDGWPVCSQILPPKEQGARLSFARKQAALSMMGIAPRESGDSDLAPGVHHPAPGAPKQSGGHVLLIEGSGLMFRAFHACPAFTRTADGAPVGAVIGFVGILRRLLESMRGPDVTHVAVIFDAGRRTFRNTIAPDYKANRPPLPEGLVSQMPLMRAAVEALGVAWVSQAGFEADDLIATYARQATNAGASVTIVSPDKDMMQLIAPGVRMFDPQGAEFTRQSALDKFGAPPERVTDAQALIGDTTDNVKGAPGIGPIKAGELLAKFGSLEGILARLPEVDERLRPAIEENAQALLVSKRLVTLCADAPTAQAWTAFPVREIDTDKFDAFMADLGPNLPASVTRPVANLSGELPEELPAKPGDAKMCSELLLRVARSKRPAQLAEWMIDFTDRRRKLSQPQIAALEQAYRDKCVALGIECKLPQNGEGASTPTRTPGGVATAQGAPSPAVTP